MTTNLVEKCFPCFWTDFNF